MYDHVLIPTDGSDTVSETLRHALHLAENTDATVHGLYVVDTRITAAAPDENRPDVVRALEAEGEAAVAEVAERAQDRGLDVVESVRKGTPVREILSYAEESSVDVIVIGTQGKTPREKVTSLGSVSERVVDDASIPVFVVKASER